MRDSPIVHIPPRNAMSLALANASSSKLAGVEADAMIIDDLPIQTEPDWLDFWFEKEVWKIGASMAIARNWIKLPQQLDAAAHIVRNCDLNLINPCRGRGM